MIGGGIFVVIGVAAAFSGPALFLAILIAAVPATLNGLSAAACGAALPRSGGTYHFGRILLSPFAGFMAGWLFLFAEGVADAAAVIGFAGYVNAFFPSLPFRGLVIALGLLVTALNYTGISITSRVNIVLVAFKVSALAFFVALGIRGVQPANFSPFLPSGWYGVVQGAALLFFAFTGYARVATLAEEVTNPGKTIPRAVLLALAVSSLLYVATAVVAIGLAGAPALSRSTSPLADAIRQTSQFYAPLAITLGAAIATASVFLTGLAGLSRVAFAMGRNGDLPSLLSYVDPKYRSPVLAVVLGGAVTTVLAATIDLTSLAAVASFAFLIYYAITNVAAMRLDRQTRGFTVVLPIAGAALCLVLTAFLPIQAILAGIAILGAGALYYLIRGLVSTAP